MTITDWVIVLAFLVLVILGVVAFSPKAFAVLVVVIIACRLAKGERL